MTSFALHFCPRALRRCGAMRVLAARRKVLTLDCLRSGLLDCAQHGYPQSQQRGGWSKCKVLVSLFSTPPPGFQLLTAQPSPPPAFESQSTNPTAEALRGQRQPSWHGARSRPAPPPLRMLTFACNVCGSRVSPVHPPMPPAARDRPIDDVEDTRGYDFIKANDD